MKNATQLVNEKKLYLIMTGRNEMIASFNFERNEGIEGVSIQVFLFH